MVATVAVHPFLAQVAHFQLRVVRQELVVEELQLARLLLAEPLAVVMVVVLALLVV
jgi:hypothetical protein